MKQVLIIHGGDSFSSYEAYLDALTAKQINYERLKPQKKWKPWIAEQMTDTDVLLPEFPNGYNAVFEEWKIYFEKILPLLGDDVQLVGHSLGAMFLAKYLQQNPLVRPVKRLVLIAGSFDDETTDEGSFVVGEAGRVPESAQEVHLFHSQDDPVVPFAQLTKFQADLPNAISHVFTDRGHFLQPEFPELLELLQK